MRSFDNTFIIGLLELFECPVNWNALLRRSYAGERFHYSDITVGIMASQITANSSVCSTVLTSQKIAKPALLALCEGNPLVTGGFSSPTVSNAGSAMAWRHHGFCVFQEPPYTVIKDPNGSGNDNYDGYVPELMKKIATKINLKYNFKLVADGKYGRETNGEWSGAIGEVKNQVGPLWRHHMSSSSLSSLLTYTDTCFGHYRDHKNNVESAYGHGARNHGWFISLGVHSRNNVL